jgi:hypothetical protein
MTRFELTDKQEAAVNAFHPDCRKRYTGAIGGGDEYRFCPCSIGVAVIYKCKCGAELDLTEYENW